MLIEGLQNDEYQIEPNIPRYVFVVLLKNKIK